MNQKADDFLLKMWDFRYSGFEILNLFLRFETQASDCKLKTLRSNFEIVNLEEP